MPGISRFSSAFLCYTMAMSETDNPLKILITEYSKAFAICKRPYLSNRQKIIPAPPGADTHVF